jgi:hypothetical protein
MLVLFDGWYLSCIGNEIGHQGCKLFEECSLSWFDCYFIGPISKHFPSKCLCHFMRVRSCVNSIIVCDFLKLAKSISELKHLFWPLSFSVNQTDKNSINFSLLMIKTGNLNADMSWVYLFARIVG